MAEIFLAKTFTGLGTERLTAIKRILPHYSDDENFGEMLIEEAKLCAQLSHANIVQTYDLGKSDSQFYIAMEYVEGFDLNRLLGMIARARLMLPFQFAIYIIIETLRGLDYAHRMTDDSGNPLGIIHRDVSPTNVLISTEGEVKVCDFGIAKAVMRDREMDSLDDTHLKGKIAYMAPEHIAGESVDCRADLYAAGILLWELLSGKRLFKPRDSVEEIKKAKQARIAPVADRGFPEHEMINAITMKALSLDPENRFQSGQQFIRALREYMHLAGLIVSQLKFSEFLREHFGANLQEMRRERERNLAELLQFEREHGTAPMEEPSEIREHDSRAEAILATFAHSDDYEETDSNVVLGEQGNNSTSSNPAEPSPAPETETEPPSTLLPPRDHRSALENSSTESKEGRASEPGHRKDGIRAKRSAASASTNPTSQHPQKREAKKAPATSVTTREKQPSDLLRWIAFGILVLAATVIAIYVFAGSPH